MIRWRLDVPPEDWKLPFVTLEIETGLTHARLAVEAYRSGRKRDGDKATARAMKALESVQLLIAQVAASDQDAAHTRLVKLKQAIEGIDVAG